MAKPLSVDDIIREGMGLGPQEASDEALEAPAAPRGDLTTPGAEALTTPGGAVTGDPRVLRRRAPGEPSGLEQAATAARPAASRLAVEAAPPLAATATGLAALPLGAISPAIPPALAAGAYIATRAAQPRLARALGVEPPEVPGAQALMAEAVLGELTAGLGARTTQGTARTAGRLLGPRSARREAETALDAAHAASARTGLEVRETGLAGSAEVATSREAFTLTRLERARAAQAARGLTEAAREADRLARQAEQAATSAAGRVTTLGKGALAAEQDVDKALRDFVEAQAAPGRAEQALAGVTRQAEATFEGITGLPASQLRQFDTRVRAKLDVRADAAASLRAFRRDAGAAFEKVRELVGTKPVVATTRFDDTIRQILGATEGTPGGVPTFARRVDLGENAIESVGGVPLNPGDPYQAALMEAIREALAETGPRTIPFDKARMIQAQLRDVARSATPIGTIRQGQAWAAYKAISDDLDGFLSAPTTTAQAKAIQPHMADAALPSLATQLDAAKQQWRLGKSKVNGRLKQLFRDQPEGVIEEVFSPDAGEALLDFKAIVGDDGFRAAQTAWLATRYQRAQVVAPSGARLLHPGALAEDLARYERTGALDAILAPEQAERIKALVSDLARIDDQAKLVTTAKGTLQKAHAEADLLERQAKLSVRRAEVERAKAEAITEQTRATERALAAQQTRAQAQTGGLGLEQATQRAEAAKARLRQTRETAGARARTAREAALTADRALLAAKERAAAVQVRQHGGISQRDVNWFWARAIAGGGAGYGLADTLGVHPGMAITAGLVGVEALRSGVRAVERRVVTPNAVRTLMGGRLPGVPEERVVAVARLLGYGAAPGAVETVTSPFRLDGAAPAR